MKKFVVASFLLSFLLVAATAFAQNPDVSLSTNEVNMFNGEDQTLDISITNNGNVADIFSISVFPHSWNYVNVDPTDTILEIASGETRTSKIYVSALTEAQFGARTVVVTVFSIKNPKIATNQTMLLRINRRSPVSIVDISTEKTSYSPGEQVKIDSVVSNIGNIASENFALRTTISKDNNVIATFNNFIDTVAAKSKKTFTNRFTIESGSEPGTYSINSVLFNELGFTVSSKSKNLEVEKVEKVSQSSSLISLGFLSATTLLTAKNEGNVPSDVKMTTSVPYFARDLFIPETAPDSVENVGNGLVYTWVVKNVAAGKEASVKYQFIVWQVWVLFLALGGITFLAFRYVFTPMIIKRHSHFGSLTKDREVLISLDVKNKSLFEVKDIVVRDFVPGIAKIVPRFDSIKPTIKEGSNGTELFWRFDSLRPGEERILAYRIKPVMDVVGSIRLPSAMANYTTRKKARKRIVSSGISIHSGSHHPKK